MIEEEKNSFTAGNPPSHYGTFQGVLNSYPPLPPSTQPLLQPVVGFPQPVAPPGPSISDPHFPVHSYQNVSSPHGCSLYHSNGYQAAPAYVVYEGRPIREHRLPCCGMGMGWLLFLIGFFFGGIPWYIGTFILLCVHVDYREKPGYVACAIASVIAMFAVTFGLTKGGHIWQA
ncbi:60S ribosomal protein L18a-like protein [Carica papaya]|uniref:60S ribosomal protein L18a-like protein n=1 Tax=Carica papaya TaxID=3649 RepID=UPI000B8CEF94|nr:60S ribosomal protein L18a-like protein [Carica papaya]